MRRVFHFFGERTEDGFVVHDRDEVRQHLLDLEGALYTLGGAVTVVSVREQVGPETYVTVGMIVNYDSYTPAAKRAQTGSEEAPDDTAEEAVDGAADTS